MNQILVTERVIVTPEFKRKKKIYKISFMVSIILMISLCSYYAFSEWKKSKDVGLSQDILSNISMASSGDSTTVKVDNNVIIVSLDQEQSDEAINVDHLLNPAEAATSEYQTIDGQSYLTESVLNIPSLGINYPVLSETSEELLKVSLNKFWGPAPNTTGNYCIVGHNYKNGKLFGKLSQINVGDLVELKDMKNNTVQYKVYDMYVVSPSDVSCTSQLTGNKREVTLITCKNYGTERLIVKCREI